MSNIQPIIGPIKNINDYLRYVNNIPTLQKEEEHDLINHYQLTNDITSAQKLVMSNLKYVYFIAKDFVKFPLPIEDMIQEGNIALFTSIKKFNLSFDVKYIAFATFHIKQAIQNYVLSNMNIIKKFTTKPMRKLFSNAFKYDWDNNTADYINQISSELNVPERDVRRYKEIKEHKHIDVYDMEYDMNGGVVEYNTPLSILLDNEQIINNDIVYNALTALDERSRDIVVSRHLMENKLTLSQLSEKYNVSCERIRQLESIALNKLKRNLSSYTK
jgi:RNA polymerase sigma-32 factor